MNDLSTNVNPRKSFWERPEGFTGMFAIGLGALGVFLAGPFLISLFNTAITLVGQAITLTILGAVLVGLVAILSNKKFQTLVSYMFKSAMRKITGAFVEIDPIGIMKSYIEDLFKKREIMEESISKLRGQINICQKQVDQNAVEYDRQMKTFKVATEKQMQSAATVASRQAGRLEKLNKESLGPLLHQMQVHLRALNKYYEVTGTVIEDLKNEVAAQDMQRKMIQASYSAMSTAKKILMGGTDQKELFDQAMEYTVQDYSMKLGSIEQFIENSKGFVEGLDIQNGVYEADALAKLQAWEKQADNVLLGNTTKQQLLEQHVAVPSIVGTANQFDFSKLLR